MRDCGVTFTLRGCVGDFASGVREGVIGVVGGFANLLLFRSVQLK